MLSVNKKLYQVLRLNFGIQKTNISEHTNIIQAYNLCDWELELLYYKIENAFNIEIKKPVPKDEISFKKLEDAVLEILFNNLIIDKLFHPNFIMIKIIKQNKPLFWLGNAMIIIFLLLLCFYPFNDTIILGLNSVIKPMKFALSIWIYSWTMALILHYVNNTTAVKIYSWVAVICMGFEQAAITMQALRGELSHFNRTNIFGMVVFVLMGVFILTITLFTVYITCIFIKQKTYKLHAAKVLSIKIGLVYFIVFSLYGGYISSLPGHTIGAPDGSKGLPFLNWSTLFGDVRVAHFFGIHSLQIIPLFAVVTGKYFATKSTLLFVKIFSVLYICFVIFVLLQSVKGIPFIG